MINLLQFFRRGLLKGGTLVICALSVITVSAQNAAVTGRVTGERGEPLAGVMITPQGTQNVGISDADGNYSVQASADATLDFSLLSYAAQSVPVQGRTRIDVVMVADAQAIDDVVVVGYGTRRVTNLTGSVAAISGEKLENRSVPTITQALQGTVANLNISTPNGAPGTSQGINIRGYTGINIDDNGTKSNSMGSPLIVIDGVQGGNLSSINMNDVESISVLKDAASSAIYGSSAPYGVIIVTTKKGRSGKPTITYSNNFGFSNAINLPNYTNSLEFANMFNETGVNSNYTAKPFTDDVIGRIKDYMSGKIMTESTINPLTDSYLAWNQSNANNDWFDIYFKTSFQQQHNVGVSGGSDNSNYYIGLGYVTQDGLYNWANDTYKRYNARVNVSSDLTKWMTVNFRSAVSRAQTDNPTIYGGVSGGSSFSYDYFHQIGRTWPTVPLYNTAAELGPDGNPTGKIVNGGFSEGSGVQLFTEGGRRKSTLDNIVLTGEFVFHLAEGWDATVNYSYDGSYRDYSDHQKTFYITKPSGATSPRGGTSPNRLVREMYKYQHHTVNAFTSYEKQLGDHYLQGMVGFTQELNDRITLQGSNTNLYSDNVPSLSLTNGTNINALDWLSQMAIRGGFARLNYNYKEKYLVEFNGRYDGTSRFMKDVRFKFYPGVSAAWVPSKESFWEPLSGWFDNLKIRGSWASLGDQAFTSSWYPFYPSMGTTTASSNDWIFGSAPQSSVSLPGLVNYNLTWITTNTLGFGVDMSFLNRRLNVSFDWYKRNAKDFAGFGQELPALLGTSAPRMNDAETETKGWELTAGWNDRKGDFSYGVNVVLSDYKGKVLKFNNKEKLISGTWYDGMTMGEIWGYETVGLFRDQAEIDATDQSYLNANWYPGDVHYKDRNGDGKLGVGRNTVDDPGDRTVIGNSTPRYSFGVTLNGAWKNLDMNIFFQGVGKRDIMFATNSNYFWGISGDEWQSAYFTVHRDRWTEDNPDGYLPRAYFNTDKNRQAQSRYLQSAAYLRLKNLQIGYTIPESISGRIGLQKARVFANVENLFTVTGLMKIMDPEMANSSGKDYPLRRTWAFGINLTF